MDCPSDPSATPSLAADAVAIGLGRENFGSTLTCRWRSRNGSCSWSQVWLPSLLSFRPCLHVAKALKVARLVNLNKFCEFLHSSARKLRSDGSPVFPSEEGGFSSSLTLGESLLLLPPLVSGERREDISILVLDVEAK